MKANKIIYWITTVIVAGLFLMSSVMYLIHNPQVTGGFRMLGYPPYVVDMLGVAKLLGVVALLQTRYAKLKEWAYAGFTITLIGATWTHMATGTPFIMPIVILLVLAASYYTWNNKIAVLKLQQ